MSEINKTFLVKANEFVFSFDQEEIDKADFIKKNPAEFNIIKDNRSVMPNYWNQISLVKI